MALMMRNQWAYQQHEPVDRYARDEIESTLDGFGYVEEEPDFLDSFLTFMTRLLLLCILALCCIALVFTMQRIIHSTAPLTARIKALAAGEVIAAEAVPEGKTAGAAPIVKIK